MDQPKPRYFVSHKCTGCNALDKGGNPLRDFFDLRKDQDVPTKDIVAEGAEKFGFVISQQNLDRHFRLHSPWLKEKKSLMRTAKYTNAIQRGVVEHRAAEEEVQKLIDVGGDRIDKGEIPVDKDLYMFAIDRRIKNVTPISIDNLVMNFGTVLAEQHKKERYKYEGEVLNGTTPEP